MENFQGKLAIIAIMFTTIPIQRAYGGRTKRYRDAGTFGSYGFVPFLIEYC